jgi:N-methylhydantoinase B
LADIDIAKTRIDHTPANWYKITMQNIIEIEVFNKLFSSIAEEMGIVLRRSAFSANIKERCDFSCAIFDHQGELVAQAAHIPVHLGAMPETLNAVLKQFTLQPGDIIISNDPFQGGSHLPDITLIAGLHDESGKILFYVVNRAHHADVGGKTPGSMGFSRSLADEGILISPTLLYKKGELNKYFFKQFLGAVRNPAERQGDIKAQRASLRRGITRLNELLARYGSRHIFTIVEQLKDYGEKVMGNTISQLPDNIYSFTDYLDNDGLSRKPLPIALELIISGDKAQADFSQSALQIDTPLNTVRAVTISAVMYAFQCLVGEGYPINHGSYRPITVKTRPGTILDSKYPVPVAAGNVETSQRIVDTLFGALAQAVPNQIPAASCGSMNNIAIGSADGQFTYYETIAGGMGGRPGKAGLSGIHTHMTNTMNTPVEALEHSYPLQIEKYGLWQNSGGKGRFSGGNGIIRVYRFLETSQVSLLMERRKLVPYGLAGGEPGKKGESRLVRGKKRRKTAGKTNFQAEAGDRLIIKTPGGGGWGKK